jgi:uncharacterized protein YqjF (DUF2071 family)
MPSPLALRRVPPLIRQRWRNVSFLHWAVPPDEVQCLLPAGLTVDTQSDGGDELGWVTLTPFRTTCSLLGVPLAGDRRFPETNVRTYVRGPDGRDGLWFFSLDVTNMFNAVLGRAIQLPYFRSEMRVDERDGWHYQGERRSSSRSASYDIVVRPRHVPAASTPLDVFLTGRWSAYVEAGGRLVRFDVEHEPWPLEQADLVRLDETMLAAVGISRPKCAPLVHYAAGVNADLAPANIIPTRRRFAVPRR